MALSLPKDPVANFGRRVSPAGPLGAFFGRYLRSRLVRTEIDDDSHSFSLCAHGSLIRRSDTGRARVAI
jgi:hypothetical protein